MLTIYDYSDEWESDMLGHNEYGPVHPLRIKLIVPSIKQVCDRCHGTGVHDHPAFSNGITSDEWSQWTYDERDDYKSGVYDVTCTKCKGKNVIDEPDWDMMTDSQRELADKYYQEESDYYNECAAERRMGA